MTESFWNTLIVAVVSPVLLIVLQQWFKRAERKEDFARQDAIAAKVEAARVEAASARTVIETVLVKVDGLLAERDKSNVKEGEQKEKLVGEEKARAVKQAQLEEREIERERTKNETPLVQNIVPVPVVDDKVAEAINASARATAESAKATQHVADAAEKDKGK